MYPDPHQYLENSPHFARAFGGRAFEHGTAQYVDGFLAAALWLPPGVQPDEEALVALVENSVPASHRGAVLGLFEQMGGYHPHEPHWHLPLIGTDPTQQGKGHGSALLRHALAICDRQQIPAYLEATSERSVPLYRRHGFEILGTVQVGTSPPIIPMLRRPR
jgi:ribosomal protein S18 acetylase RimI-like enzyme